MIFYGNKKYGFDFALVKDSLTCAQVIGKRGYWMIGDISDAKDVAVLIMELFE